MQPIGNSSRTTHKARPMNKEGKLKIIASREQHHEFIENRIISQASHRESLNILEAGCGRRWPYNLEGIKYTLTGVDVDKEALEARKNIVSDLHEAIEGDLCTVDLGVEVYDVIYCSYVLEHVEKADVVIKNFVKWIKPDGIIIILIPDPNSVQGFVTRITPHWFHVFYHRFFLGKKNAGKPGFGPYATYYHPVVSRSGMRDFCNDENNRIEILEEYADGFIKPGRSGAKTILRILKRAINIISLGKLSDKHTNLLFVIRKKND
jgi:SAM-dependent methyltransferase